MSERILLIEDDPELGRQIFARLRQAGFVPVWWREGRRIAPGDLPEVALVILDLMLPKAYGLDILRDLREFSEVPVLVLSARKDTSDKIKALRLGADDYVTKPFWPEELLERVRARLRRPVLRRGDIINLGPLHLDLSLPQARVGETIIHLTRAEFTFLVLLAKRPGQAVTRSTLARRVLDPEREVSDRALDVHASRLRKKLGEQIVIETVWGIGYRLVGDP